MNKARKGWQVSGTGNSAAKAGQEVTDAAQSTRNIFGLNRISVMMGLMFAGGMIWVYFASLQTQPVAKNEENDLNVTIVTSGLFDMTNASLVKDNPKTQVMMQAVYYSAKERQIPLVKLRGNLFKFVTPEKPKPPTETTTLVTTPPTEDPGPPPKVPPTDGLSLQTILWEEGKPPTAIIANHLIGVGDVINDWTVHKIEKKRVILRWKNKRFELKMP
ncbi:MAG: hypothetical protein K8S55_03085 [Phycisphaerae bacterium]|nr:hypothetical protein [Phycisphaerae bacterium]